MDHEQPDEMDLNDGLDMGVPPPGMMPVPTVAERALLLGCVVLVIVFVWYFAGKI